MKDVKDIGAKNSWFITLKKGWINYSQQTSLHGWHYISSERQIFDKCIWMLPIIGSVLLALTLGMKNFTEYLDNKTRTSLQTTTAPLRELSFPTIHICNANQVTHTFIQEIVSDTHYSAKTDFFYYEFIFGSRKNRTLQQEVWMDEITGNLTEKFNWTDTKQIRKFSSQPCKDMLIRTSKGGKGVGYYNAYQSTNDAGICCALIPHLIFEKSKELNGSDYKQKSSILRHGETHGLKLLLDVESFDYAYRKTGSTGFKIAIANTLDKASLDQNGVNIAPGAETRVAAKISKTVTTEEAIYALSPEKRDCYTDNEIKLLALNEEDGYRYSLQNCLHEAVIQNVVFNCSCIPMFVEPEPIVNRYNLTDAPICTRKRLQCAESWLKGYDVDLADNLTTIEVLENNQLVPKKCLPRCDQDEITATTTFSKYPNIHVFKQRRGFCRVMRKLKKICYEASYQVKRSLLEGYYGKICESLNYAYATGKMCYGAQAQVDDEDLETYSKVADTVIKYAQDNVAYVKIYLKDPFYTIIEKDQAVTGLDLFNSLGGMFGLCLGLSLISVFEVFYHLFKTVLKLLNPTY